MSLENPHERYMRMALELAAHGEGRVEPNPMVGAVIVKDGEVIGKGYHEYFGGPHAEVNAISTALGNVKGAVLYVTLETCAHFGKTPPCVDAVIASGITKVVIACLDPNPLVHSRGVKKLKEAGIEVIEGVLEKEARRLNAPFFKNHIERMPYYIAKWAMTLDGKTSDRYGNSMWITDARTREFAKNFRLKAGAVMAGIGTVLADNPRLLGPEGSNRNPKRIIVDTQGRLPLDSEIIKTISKTETYVAVSEKADEKNIEALYKHGCKILQIAEKNGRIDFTALSGKLLEQGIGKVFLEGGPKLIADAFAERLVDKVIVFIGPEILTDPEAFPAVNGKSAVKISEAIRIRRIFAEQINDDALIMGEVEYPNPGSENRGPGSV